MFGHGSQDFQINADFTVGLESLELESTIVVSGSKKIHAEGSELAIPEPNKPATGHCDDLLRT